MERKGGFLATLGASEVLWAKLTSAGYLLVFLLTAATLVLSIGSFHWHGGDSTFTCSDNSTATIDSYAYCGLFDVKVCYANPTTCETNCTVATFDDACGPYLDFSDPDVTCSFEDEKKAAYACFSMLCVAVVLMVATLVPILMESRRVYYSRKLEKREFIVSLTLFLLVASTATFICLAMPVYYNTVLRQNSTVSYSSPSGYMTTWGGRVQWSFWLLLAPSFLWFILAVLSGINLVAVRRTYISNKSDLIVYDKKEDYGAATPW